jgi:regulator of ribonuclease activity A
LATRRTRQPPELSGGFFCSEEKMHYKTTDLCDANDSQVQVADPLFRIYGRNISFSGRIATVKVFEDNVLVRGALSEPGHGGVLVVDGGGSLRCALVGGLMAQLAENNGWSGIIVYGCVRDANEINACALGVRALNTHPRRSVKKGAGDRDIPVAFAGITFVPGHHLYADEDGVIVAPAALSV